MKTSNKKDARAVALDVIARGWSPIPVPIGKAPKLRKWQKLEITRATVGQYFNGAKINVGALMGPQSNGLTDVDLDCSEAVALAPYFLPKTDAIYGRPSKRRSHHLYQCRDPDAKASIKLHDEKKRCIVELRLGGGGKGAQSVMPGSMHTSGEPYEWDVDGKPTPATCAELKDAISKIAVATILVRHWPNEGSRHDAALGLGGFLARANWTTHDAQHFIGAICDVIGDTEVEDRKKAVTDSIDNFAKGEKVHGLPWLGEFFTDKPMATTIAKIIGYGDVVDSTRPLIRIKAGQLPAMTTRAEEILLAAQEPIYQRGPMLMRPIVEDVDAAHGRKTKVARFVQLGETYLCDVLGTAANWQRYDGRAKIWVNVDAPAKVASTLLARQGKWKFLIVAGVISTPTLRPDGALLIKAGYDPATRLLLVAPPEMPPIPEAPTRTDALAARDLLIGLLVEFPFVTLVDRAVALSAMITPVARGAITVAPMHAANAPVAGSGKSYLFDIVAAIAIGQMMPVMAAGRKEEETEKRLGASVITGQPLISIDNVNGELRGDALCQLIDRPIVEIRILGKTEKIRVEARSGFYCNGNNIMIVGDLCRRVITTNLDPRLERPELREFKGNPVAKILANRGTYIAAALTICRAYIVAGRPNKAKRLASFEDWSDTVRSALIWLGEADPVKSIEAVRIDDPELAQLRALLLAWVETIGLGFQFRTTLQDIVAVSEERTADFASTLKWPELHAAVQAIAGWHGQSSDVHDFGRWAQSKKNRLVNGLRLVNKPNKKGGSQWWVDDAAGTNKAGRWHPAKIDKPQKNQQKKRLGTRQA